MKTGFFNIFLFTFIVAGGAAAIAVPPAERVAVTIEPTETAPVIGDSLSLIVSVALPAGANADTPYLPAESPDIDVFPHWEHTDSTGMGATRKQFGMLAYVYRPDTLVVGPFLVDYTTADGDPGSVLSEPVTLLVNGVLEGENITPAPDRGPVEIPRGFPWLIAVTAIAVIALAAYLIARRRRPAPAVTVEQPVDDIEIFRRIAARRLHESGEILRLYIQVSDALREFIHRRMGYDARFRTTWEIRRSLDGRRPHRDTIPALLEILDEADMVKFARYAPPAEDAASIADRSIDIVKRILDEIERERERIAAAAREAASRKPDNKPVTADLTEGGR